MHVHALTWIITTMVIIGLLLFDFFAHVRKPHEPTLKEAGIWSGVYVGFALLFAGFIHISWGGQYSGEYLAGWLTEKSLSVDNLFVFLIILTSFNVPRIYQQKVLLFGIGFALILRTIFILAGAALLAQFAALFYLFGLVLILTAVSLLREKDEEAEFKENFVLRTARKLLPTSTGFDKDKLFTRENGKKLATPLLIVLIAIGTTDVLFALDSIPAIFGLTKEPYLVFSANAFALLGLRQLFFLLDGLLKKLVHLSKGLAVILLFIGAKLILEALHTNSVPFINNGNPVKWAPEIPIWVSLSVILGTLTTTIITSLISERRAKKLTAHHPLDLTTEQLGSTRKHQK